MTTTSLPTTTRPQPASLPEPCPADLRRAVDSALSGSYWASGRLVLLDGKAPGAAMRRDLADRASMIDRWLGARDRQRVAALVAQMLAGFSASRANGDEAKYVVASYVAALDGQPTWAVAEAIRRVISGTPSPYAPSTSQLAAAAADIASPYRRELQDLRSLLTAAGGGPTQAERERVAQGFDRLREELRRGLREM